MKPIIDISSWQAPTNINYGLLSEQIDGVIIRIGIGTVKDYHFERHYQEFNSRGKQIGFYHVPANDNPQAQANMVKAAISGKATGLFVWADVEASYQTRAGVNAYIPVMEAALGFQLGIYTSKTKWLEVMQNEMRWASRQLWVAAYGYAAPLLPPAWTQCALWQYSSTGRLAGYNDNLDLNRPGETYSVFLPIIVTPEPEPEPEILFTAKVITTPPNRLITRYTPNGVSRPQCDWLQSQAIVPVYETVPGWHRVGIGSWASATYLRRVDEPLPPPPVSVSPYYGPLYWQRDSRWKDKPLGTSGTIGSYGCAMVAETNILNQLGVNTNPILNNAWRTANGGYRNGNLIDWAKVTVQHPSIIWEEKTYNPTDAMIKQKLNDGCGLVLLVDHNEGTPGLDEHWVNTVPTNDGAIWIHDPWDNVTLKLRDRYKKALQQYSSYKRVV